MHKIMHININININIKIKEGRRFSFLRLFQRPAFLHLYGTCRMSQLYRLGAAANTAEDPTRNPDPFSRNASPSCLRMPWFASIRAGESCSRTENTETRG